MKLPMMSVGSIEEFWNKHSRIIASILILLISMLAFWLRMQQYVNVAGSGIGALYPEAKLDELDPFFNHWVVEYLDKHGPLSWFELSASNTITCIFWYPSCRSIYSSELPGHIYTIYFLYTLVKPLGVDLWDLMSFIPPTLALLATIFIALAVNEATNSKVGAIVASLMYSLFFISREVAGFTVKYTFGIFTAPLVLWLHLRAFKRGSYTDFVIAALALSYSASTWTGIGLTAIPIYIALILTPLLIDLSKRDAWGKYGIGFAIETLVPAIIMYTIPSYHGGRLVLVLSFIAAFLIFGYALLLHHLLGRARAVKIYIYSLVTVIVIGVATIVLARAVPGFLEALTSILPVAGKILLGLGIRPPGLAETVAQYQPGSLGGLPIYMLLGILTLVFIYIPIAVYELLKNRNMVPVTIAAWFFLAWFATYNTAYFSDYTKLATSILIGCTMGSLLRYSKPTIIRLGRLARLRYGFTQVVALLLAISVGIPSTLVAYDEHTTYYYTYTMVSRAEGFIIPTTVWLDVLNFIKMNTSANSLIISWWDYGYWLTGIARRTTLADGATIDSRKIELLAQFFTGNINGSLQYLKNYFGACKKDEVYVVVFSPVDVYATANGNVYAAFPIHPAGFGDIAKFVNAIVYLATHERVSEAPFTVIQSYQSPYYMYATEKILSNKWIVNKSITIGQSSKPLDLAIGLNWNSETVLNATMPRLFAWSVLKTLEKLYPGLDIRIVPWLISYGVDQQGRLQTYIDISSLIAGSIDVTSVEQELFDIAYVGVSQPLVLGSNFNRYIVVSLLKLKGEVLENLCR
ncbi:MAG: STT3 domain-containing protein [Ignisphaera sp.]